MFLDKSKACCYILLSFSFTGNPCHLPRPDAGTGFELFEINSCVGIKKVYSVSFFHLCEMNSDGTVFLDE